MEPIPILPPTFCYPKKDPEHYCECQDRPVELTHKTCYIFWQKTPGQRVEEGEVLAEAEADKKTVELPSPTSGILLDICVQDGEEFQFGEALGHIQPGV